MQQQSRKGVRKLWLFGLLIVVIAALLFWLEWLGSEQSMTAIDQPVLLPKKAGTVK
ncbi:MAG: hypothetical protein V3V15_04960 [Sphingorhabdus sp.]